MAHEIVDGWTVEVRDSDTLKLEFIGHFRNSDLAQQEANYWVDCRYKVKLYCNGCFQGTREV